MTWLLSSWKSPRPSTSTKPVSDGISYAVHWYVGGSPVPPRSSGKVRNAHTHFAHLAGENPGVTGFVRGDGKGLGARSPNALDAHTDFGSLASLLGARAVETPGSTESARAVRPGGQVRRARTQTL